MRDGLAHADCEITFSGDGLRRADDTMVGSIYDSGIGIGATGIDANEVAGIFNCVDHKQAPWSR